MALFYSPWTYLLGLALWLVLLGGSLRGALRYRRQVQARPERRRWIDLALAGWMLLAALTALELLVAVGYDTTDSFDLSNVSKRWFRRHVQLNPQGFRDPRPWTRIPAEGRRRIVFLGDSFTYGHGINRVADRFSERVEAGLNQRHPGKYETANLGFPGYGTNDMVPLWQKIVLETDSEADIAVYTICLNDIEWFVEGNLERYTQRPSGPQFFLLRDTYFFNLVYYRVQQLTVPKVRNYYDDLQEQYRGRAFELMCAELDQLRATLKKSDTELRLVIFPFLHNLGPDYPFHEAHQRLVKYAQKRGVKILDLEPVLTPHIADGLTVNRFDAHPNERAHQLAADAILKDLLSDL